MNNNSAPDISGVIFLLSEIQNSLYEQRTIQHELSQIIRHTRHQEMIKICSCMAECLGFDLDYRFHEYNRQQQQASLNTLRRKIIEAKDKFKKVQNLCTPSASNWVWVESSFDATKWQLQTLSTYLKSLENIYKSEDTVIKYSSPNPARGLAILGEIQKKLHDKKLRHELSQIVRHTQDTKFHTICLRAADLIGIEIDSKFIKANDKQRKISYEKIQVLLKSINNDFDRVLEFASPSKSVWKWLKSPFRETEKQLLMLSDCVVLLDREPCKYDDHNQAVKAYDLVAIACTDQNNKPYEHYGIVLPSGGGFRVAHFFGGRVIEPRNTLIDEGYGYIHEVQYESKWIVKESLPERISHIQVEQRIAKSRDNDRRIWNKRTYNCEDWAREMFCGVASCTQRDEIKKQARERRANRETGD